MINTTIAQKQYIPGHSNYQEAEETDRYPHALIF